MKCRLTLLEIIDSFQVVVISPPVYGFCDREPELGKKFILHGESFSSDDVLPKIETEIITNVSASNDSMEFETARFKYLWEFLGRHN